MTNVNIYYFSGSGNTLKIAKVVQEKFESLGYHCSLMKIENVKEEPTSCDYIGLMFPVAIQSTFPLVWKFVNDLPEIQGQKIFMIDTMEAYSGGVVGPMKKTLSQKGYDCIGAVEIKMTNSMETNMNKREKGLSKNKLAPQVAEKFVDDLINNKTHWRRIPLLSDGMRGISVGRKIWTKESEHIAVIHDECINCGLCIRRCPVQGISEEKGVIVINHEVCESCMRCVTHCPKDAFTLKGKKVLSY